MTVLLAWSNYIFSQETNSVDPVVVERGPHHRTWQRTTVVPSADGTIAYRTSFYQELGTTMHYWKDVSLRIFNQGNGKLLKKP